MLQTSDISEHDLNKLKDLLSEIAYIRNKYDLMTIQLSSNNLWREESHTILIRSFDLEDMLVKNFN